MQISTTVRHCELDPEDRLFAHQRLEKLGRFARDIREVHLIVSAEKYRHSAEITVRLKHRDMVSREESTAAEFTDRLAVVMAEHESFAGVLSLLALDGDQDADAADPTAVTVSTLGLVQALATAGELTVIFFAVTFT